MYFYSAKASTEMKLSVAIVAKDINEVICYSFVHFFRDNNQESAGFRNLGGSFGMNAKLEMQLSKLCSDIFHEITQLSLKMFESIMNPTFDFSIKRIGFSKEVRKLIDKKLQSSKGNVGHKYFHIRCKSNFILCWYTFVDETKRNIKWFWVINAIIENKIMACCRYFCSIGKP